MQLGFRFYDPKIGRFTQLDPIGDGLNWYVYCGGDPKNGVDPWGLSYLGDVGQGFVGMGRAIGKFLWGVSPPGMYQASAAMTESIMTNGTRKTAGMMWNGFWDSSTKWVYTTDPAVFSESLMSDLLFIGSLAAPFAKAGTVSTVGEVSCTVGKVGESTEVATSFTKNLLGSRRGSIGIGPKPKSTLPRAPNGDFIPDPIATGAHTRLGLRVGRDGRMYTQGATFDENGVFKGLTDVTDHGRPLTHPYPHWHPAVSSRGVLHGGGNGNPWIP